MGGWCWQPVMQKTSPSTNQLFQLCILSPSTAPSLQNQAWWENTVGNRSPHCWCWHDHHLPLKPCHHSQGKPMSPKPQGRERKKSYSAESLHAHRKGEEWHQRIALHRARGRKAVLTHPAQPRHWVIHPLMSFCKFPFTRVLISPLQTPSTHSSTSTRQNSFCSPSCQLRSCVSPTPHPGTLTVSAQQSVSQASR